MITFDDVSFRYANGDDNNCLSHVDFTIERGQAVLFCGASGSGKSTVTRLVNGLAPHYYNGEITGRVTVDGLDIATTELHQLTPKVGSVFQNPRSQFFTVDTDSELVFACENLGMDVADILARKQTTIAQFGISSLMGRNIFKLSGGEKQKIACASVSLHSPDVLVLDEPSSNLDSAAMEDLRRILLLWKAQGKTLLIAEHRLHFLAEVVDRVVCLHEGRICHDVTPEELTRLPREEREVLGLRPLTLKDLDNTPATSAGRDHVRAALPAPVPAPARAPGPTPAPAPGNVVTLSGFRYAYRKHEPVLDMESCSLPAAGVTAVIGRNGAGKSTFASCLSGLVRNPGLASTSQKAWKWRERLTQCFMVVQDVNHQLFGESVQTEILLSQPTEDQHAAEELLDAFNLLSLKDRHPLSLSGGEKQRVAIASAIASERPVVILDEPTSGLDLRHMRQVSAGLRMLADRGRTVIVITHDPELILTGCDHVLHLDKGSVAANYPLDAAGRQRVLRFFTTTN